MERCVCRSRVPLGLMSVVSEDAEIRAQRAWERGVGRTHGRAITDFIIKRMGRRGFQ